MAQYKRKDPFYLRAKAEGHASRAIYKLEELHKRFRLFSVGDRVLDLGCAPGSWLQFCANIVGPTGVVVGIDRLPTKINFAAQVQFVLADLEEYSMEDVRTLSGSAGFECVLSDMAPNTSGVKFQDQCRSYDLGVLAWQWAKALLKPGGNVVIKLLYGEDVKGLLDEVRPHFDKAQIFHTIATRRGSTEVYIVATGRK